MSISSTKTDVTADSRKTEARFRTLLFLLIAGIAALAALPSAAFAQGPVCGPDVKEQAAKALADLESAADSQKPGLQADLYAKFSFCAQDSKLAPSSFVAAAEECGSAVSNLGSLFYEEMPCVGYDPQRRQFAAPVKIKQPFGFGNPPLPGSREYVLHCVADAAGILVPVGRDSVHLANALGNQRPSWQFAVITSATENLQTIYPMDGQTRVARSILSWGFPPTNCNFQPIWGNALNYRIRLDQ
jgi:hypothetical protein